MKAILYVFSFLLLLKNHIFISPNQYTPFIIWASYLDDLGILIVWIRKDKNRATELNIWVPYLTQIW